MRAVIAFGSNLGDSRGIIEQAISAIGTRIGPIIAVSSIQETPPMTHPDFDVPEQGAYLNGAVLVETELPPATVLEHLLSLETELGRRRSLAVKWGPRTIDLDLILVNEQIERTPELTLPHPGMAYRDFVVGPLCELWPTWRHPILNKTAEEMFAELRSAGNVIWRLPTKRG